MNASMSAPRIAAVMWAALAALVLQTSVLPHLWLPGPWHGVVPGVVLVLVVAVGLRHGSEFAMGLGLLCGLALDLLPPADHVAGRWALALLLAGWLAGHMSHRLEWGPRRAPGQRLVATLVVVACSFVATSCFALTGLVLRDPLVGVSELLLSLVATVTLDAALGAALVPLLLDLDVRLETERLAI